MIGMNFLKNCVIQINSDMGKVLFLKPTKEGNPDWGEVFTIEYHPLGQPFISGMRFDGIKVDFMIDTGMGATGALHRVIFKEIVSKNKIKTAKTLAATAGGIIQPLATRFDKLTLGPFKYKNLIFYSGDFSSVGLSFLSRHIVSLDFPNDRLYLKKGKQFEKIDEVDMSGLHLLRISDKTVVHSVDESSPAEKVGIRANDVILKVNNKDANTYDIGEIGELLISGDKRKITMTIKRGDAVEEVSFLLEKKM